MEQEQYIALFESVEALTNAEEAEKMSEYMQNRLDKLSRREAEKFRRSWDDTP